MNLWAINPSTLGGVGSAAFLSLLLSLLPGQTLGLTRTDRELAVDGLAGRQVFVWLHTNARPTSQSCNAHAESVNIADESYMCRTLVDSSSRGVCLCRLYHHHDNTRHAPRCRNRVHCVMWRKQVLGEWARSLQLTWCAATAALRAESGMCAVAHLVAVT